MGLLVVNKWRKTSHDVLSFAIKVLCGKLFTLVFWNFSKEGMDRFIQQILVEIWDVFEDEETNCLKVVHNLGNKRTFILRQIKGIQLDHVSLVNNTLNHWLSGNLHHDDMSLQQSFLF